MERKQITTEQITRVKELVQDFKKDVDGRFFVYLGGMLPSEYCQLLRIDYATVHYLGEVSYTITYYEMENKTYQLACETYIGDIKSDKLSFVLEDSEDYLGFFTQTDEGKLPSNWRELLSDEDKEVIARDWCRANPFELKDYLTSEDERDIAYDYAHDNPSDMGDEVCSYLDSSDSRDLIIKLLDNL